LVYVGCACYQNGLQTLDFIFIYADTARYNKYKFLLLFVTHTRALSLGVRVFLFLLNECVCVLQLIFLRLYSSNKWLLLLRNLQSFVTGIKLAAADDTFAFN